MIDKRSEKNTLALAENDFNDLCHVVRSCGLPGSRLPVMRSWTLFVDFADVSGVLPEYSSLYRHFAPVFEATE